MERMPTSSSSAAAPVPVGPRMDVHPPGAYYGLDAVLNMFQKLTSKRVRQTPNCAVCLDDIHYGAIRAPCGHYYDKECIISFFELSTRVESLFPPRCCNKPIPFLAIREICTSDLRTTFLAKAKEYGTKNRVYCAIPVCSRFLGPRTSFPLRRIYQCQCGKATCARCKNLRHDRVKHTCSDHADVGAEEVIELSKTEKWARCPGCRTMIERFAGCFRMTCVCKVMFCYLCQSRWKTCDCPHWIGEDA